MHQHIKMVEYLPFVTGACLMPMMHCTFMIVFSDGPQANGPSQRQRYWSVILSALFGMIPLVGYPVAFGFNTVLYNVMEWPIRYGTVGWGITIGTCLMCLTPIWAWIDIRHIRRHPAMTIEDHARQYVRSHFETDDDYASLI